MKFYFKNIQKMKIEAALKAVDFFDFIKNKDIVLHIVYDNKDATPWKVIFGDCISTNWDPVLFEPPLLEKYSTDLMLSALQGKSYFTQAYGITLEMAFDRLVSHLNNYKGFLETLNKVYTPIPLLKFDFNKLKPNLPPEILEMLK